MKYQVKYRRVIEGYMTVEAADEKELRARLADDAAVMDLWYSNGQDDGDEIKVVRQNGKLGMPVA